MRKPLVSLLVASLVAALIVGSLVIMLGYLGPKARQAPPVAQRAAPSTESAVLDMLKNIKQHGFNADSSINNGLGGLYINWRYGTNPLQTNVGGPAGGLGRDDPLTEIRYLHNLWLYKSEHPNDSSFDSEIKRYGDIVKQEFAGSQSEYGWLYDIFMDTYKLSHDSAYQDIATSLAATYEKAFNPQVGSVFNVNSASPEGMYHVDLVLESGCALVQAGTQFNNPQWVQDGKSIILFVYSHAYIPQYHTFPALVSNVVLPDGSASPQETFFPNRAAGGQVRMSALSQIVISLLDTYQVTHNQDFLTKATDLLDPFSLPVNPLGMWDTQAGGYFFALQFTGPSPRQAGETEIIKTTKEAGLQADMLLAFHLANQATNGRYKEMEQQMLNVILKNIYIPAIHGVTSLVNADWSFQHFKNGQLNNLVTTEAMGAELEALLGQNRSASQNASYSHHDGNAAASLVSRREIAESVMKASLTCGSPS